MQKNVNGKHVHKRSICSGHARDKRFVSHERFTSAEGMYVRSHGNPRPHP